MFKFGLLALAASALCLAATNGAKLDTSFERAQDLVVNFPQYLEEALTNNDTDLEYGLGECFKDFTRLFSAMRQKKIWPFRVLDSWGKFPSGVLSGNLYDLGDFDECLNIDKHIDQPTDFIPRYCVARISKEDLLMPNQRSTQERLKSLANAFIEFGPKPQPRMVPTSSNLLGLSFGICVPKSCTPERMSQLLKNIQEKILRDVAVLALVPDTCQVKEDLNWNLNGYDIAVLTFIITLGTIMISSTIYDIIQTRKDNDKRLLFIAFSIYTNGKRLFACKRSRSEHTMDCLNGIRVFSALWVIYAHAHVMTMIAPIFNFAYIPEWASHYSTIVLLLAPFSVDTFLFLSGLLVTWSLLKHLTKTNGKANYVMLYVHRYLRLTPILAVIIMISLTLFKKIGSGPLWFTFILNAINCDKYWWSSLLYIQNYYNADSICLSHTWYLSADMQLFLFAPLMGYLLYRFGYYVFGVLGLLVAVCVGWTSWLYIHFDLVNQILNIENDIQETFILTYFPTHIRMTPWLVGVMFAYFLFKLRDRRERWNIIRTIIHWTLAAAIVIVLGYFTYQVQQMDHKATPLESAIYTPFSRLAWSVFLCLVIYACVKGYGGPVNWFLSLPVWQPFARLTYAIYLVHMPIMLMTAGSTQRPLFYSGRTILFRFLGDVFAAFLLSIIASLALESPIVILEKILFGKRTKTPIAPTSATQQPTAPANA